MAVVDYGTATNRTRYFALSVDFASWDTTLQEYLVNYKSDSGYYLVVRFISYGVTSASDSVNISTADSGSHESILRSPTGKFKRLPALFRTDGSDGMIQSYVEPTDRD